MSGRVAGRLGYAVVFVLIGGVAAQLGGALAAGRMRAVLSARGLSSEQLQHSPDVVLPAMVVSSLVLCASALSFPFAVRCGFRSGLGLYRAGPAVFIAAAIGTVALNPLGDAMMRMMDAWFPGATFGVLELLQDVAQQSSHWLIWPVFALLPGVSEELMFRGVLQNSAGRGVSAIVLSAVAFALFHADPHHVAGVLPLGFFLAWVASRAGTAVTIVAHVANNSAAIFALQSEALAVGYGADRPMPWWWLVGGLSVTAICVVVIVRDATLKTLNSDGVPCSSSPHAPNRFDR